MTKEEAEQLKSFKHYCTCGGFAWQLNHRPKEDPHMIWCPQKKEYLDWFKALNSIKEQI